MTGTDGVAQLGEALNGGREAACEVAPGVVPAADTKRLLEDRGQPDAAGHGAPAALDGQLASRFNEILRSAHGPAPSEGER